MLAGAVGVWGWRRAVGVGLAIVIAAGVAACGADGTGRDASGEVVAAGVVGLSDLRVGDCFNTPEEPLDNPVAGDGVGDVQLVPCGERHDLELFGLAGLEGDDYPSDDALDKQALEICGAEFELYAAQVQEASASGLAWFFPSGESWDDGDRQVMCALDTTDTTRDRSGAIIEVGGAHYGSLKVGDCFDTPDDFLNGRTGGRGGPTVRDGARERGLRRLRHRPRRFPGDDTLVDETEETCIMLLGSYTGVPFDDSDLSVWAFVPRADGWSLGEREARCVLYDSDLSKLTRSQKATDAGSSP